jgi:hypothetical protein
MRLFLKCILAMAPSILGAEPLVSPSFSEETASSGITTQYDGDWEYMVGGGASALDCNGDGFEDLFLSGGSSASQLYVNTSVQGGSLTFEPVKSGLEMDAVLGAYPLDIDSDGIKDLIILRLGENMAMRGLGDCKFEAANTAWGFDGGDAWSTAFAATWEKGQTWPTLAVGNYVDRKADMMPWGSCTANWLQRPAQQGFAPPIDLAPSHCALSILFTDWNQSGTASLRVSNDREYYKGGAEQMWHIEPGEDPKLYTEAEGWKRLRIWGMGIASYDLNYDGYPEYFLTSMADNKLQTLANIPAEGGVKPIYSDVAFAKGATAHRPYTGGDLRPSTAWHTQFEDINNDGAVDLFIAKGNVSTMPDFAQNDPNNLLMQDGDGNFIEMGETAGIASMNTSRGAALADFNLDGLIDIAVVNRWTTAQIWRNTTTDVGNWIAVQPKQPNSNLDAIGGWIELKLGQKTIRRELTVGGGHASGQIGWRQFGLGDQDQVDIRVIWPDGTKGDWQTLAANQRYILEKETPATAWPVQ